MRNEARDDLRENIEKRAERNGWADRYLVTVRNAETGQSETLEVPGKDAHHAAHTNAMLLVEMPLRGELVEHETQKV